MLGFFSLFQLSFSWQSMSVNRFIQYSSNETEGAILGSTRSNINALIGSIETKADSKQYYKIDLTLCSYNPIEDRFLALESSLSWVLFL